VADVSRLTDEARARLRPSIDIDALERFLAAVPQESRQLYFLACVRNITDEELQAIGIALPPLAQGPPPAPPVPVTLSDGREGWRVPFHPARNIHLALPRLAESELDRLWHQVEPLDAGGA